MPPRLPWLRSILLLLPCVTATAQVAWHEHPLLSPGPAPRTEWQLAFHEQMGRTILFGGPTGTGGWHTDTWAWDGVAWQQQFPAQSPPATRFQLLYDVARAVVLAIGDPDPSQLWEYDGTNWTQRQPTTSPPPRLSFRVAYDRARSRAVLFGGVTLTPWAQLNDTWEWNGTTWTNVASPTAPSGRFSPAMAFDPVRQRVLLLGGLVNTGVFLTQILDQWEWDGVQWTAMPTPALPPTHALTATTHLQRNRVLVWNAATGANASATHWEWDGTTWTAVVSPQYPPPNVFASPLAYDSGRNRIVLWHGGTVRQTWEWDGTTWTNLGPPPVPKPVPRFGHGLAFFTPSQRVVMFGGSNGALYTDTWQWDGASWSQLAPATSPPGRFTTRMVEHTSRGEIVLFGGQGPGGGTLGDTWVFNGTTWLQRTPASPPPARYGHGLAYDRGRDRVVLFGGWTGGNSNSTYEWDGTAWLQRFPTTSPSARQYPAMAYDEARQRVVLFGGLNLGDTWEYDGTTWVQRFPATSPPAGWPMMSYDRARARIVLFGNTTSAWEWDGVNWTARPTSLTPVPRQDGGLAYDAGRDRLVLFSGINAGTKDDTWEYGPTSPATWVGFGAGCPGTAGTPTMAPAPFALAWLGDTFVLRVTAVPPGESAFVFFGSTTQWGAVPLPAPLGPYGMPGCTLLVAGENLRSAAGLGGIADVVLPIPPAVALLGTSVAAQPLVSDPGANATGFVVGNAGTVTVGSR